MISEILMASFLAISLCMDCFAVTTCSSVTLERIDLRQTVLTGLVFAVVQAGLLFVGWAFGDLFVGYVHKIASFIGFAILVYVGGTMSVEGLSKKDEARNLNGFRNIILGAVATSIDAFAVGISLSMSMALVRTVAFDTAAVAVFTFLSVFAGMHAGHRIGKKCGKAAEIFGGIVLIVIAFVQLFN